MCAKKVTRAFPSYLEFHGMSAVTYAVKVICIRESKKASWRHVEAPLCFWPVVFQYLEPEDLVVWRLYA